MSRQKPTRHHIIPRSRGGGLEDNIAMIPNREHNIYHQLFENRTPEEIGKYLSQRFWANKYYVEVRRYGR